MEIKEGIFTNREYLLERSKGGEKKKHEGKGV